MKPLKHQLSELAGLARAAVVVEERYSQIFTLTQVRPATVADGLAELQLAFPAVPIVFCQTRTLVAEDTYRYLAAAQAWAGEQTGIGEAFGGDGGRNAASEGGEPSTAEVRAWTRSAGLAVAERRLRLRDLAGLA